MAFSSIENGEGVDNDYLIFRYEESRRKIEDVWQYDIHEEFSRLMKAMKQNSHVAICVRHLADLKGVRTQLDYTYDSVRKIVNSLPPLQVAFALFDQDGNAPSHRCASWQFNMRLGSKTKSLTDKLPDSDFDFDKHRDEGIEYKTFADLMIDYGLITNKRISWICFNGLYDIGYFIMIVTNSFLPATKEAFVETMKSFMCNLYDVRFLISFFRPTNNSLQETANKWKLKREQESAGGDAILIGKLFFIVKHGYFENMIESKWSCKIARLNDNNRVSRSELYPPELDLSHQTVIPDIIGRSDRRHSRYSSNLPNTNINSTTNAAAASLLPFKSPMSAFYAGPILSSIRKKAPLISFFSSPPNSVTIHANRVLCPSSNNQVNEDTEEEEEEEEDDDEEEEENINDNENSDESDDGYSRNKQDEIRDENSESEDEGNHKNGNSYKSSERDGTGENEPNYEWEENLSGCFRLSAGENMVPCDQKIVTGDNFFTGTLKEGYSLEMATSDFSIGATNLFSALRRSTTTTSVLVFSSTNSLFSANCNRTTSLFSTSIFSNSNPAIPYTPFSPFYAVYQNSPSVEVNSTTSSSAIVVSATVNTTATNTVTTRSVALKTTTSTITNSQQVANASSPSCYSYFVTTAAPYNPTFFTFNDSRSVLNFNLFRNS